MTTSTLSEIFRKTGRVGRIAALVRQQQRALQERLPHDVDALRLRPLDTGSAGIDTPASDRISRMHLIVPLTVIVMLAACGAGPSTETNSPGELLAQIDLEADPAPYDDRLDTLERKCEAPSRMKIADNVAGAVKVLEDNGRMQKALDIMDGMIEAIPEDSEGQVECADIATALVTIMLGGSVDATPRP